MLEASTPPEASTAARGEHGATAGPGTRLGDLRRVSPGRARGRRRQ